MADERFSMQRSDHGILHIEGRELMGLKVQAKRWFTVAKATSNVNLRSWEWWRLPRHMAPNPRQGSNNVWTWNFVEASVIQRDGPKWFANSNIMSKSSFERLTSTTTNQIINIATHSSAKDTISKSRAITMPTIDCVAPFDLLPTSSPH